MEVKFEGEAPTDELARARILANPTVESAMQALSDALLGAGLNHEVTARTIKSTPARSNAGRKRVGAPVAEAAE